MGQTRSTLITTIEDFIREQGLSERRFGEQAVGDKKVLWRLRHGFGVNLCTIERIEQFIDSRHEVAMAA